MTPVKILVISDDEFNAKNVQDHVGREHTVDHKTVSGWECPSKPDCECYYDILVVQPVDHIVEILGKIFDCAPKRPHVFVYNGQQIPYPLMKSLLKLGIAGLIEDGDLTQMTKAVSYLSQAKSICNRLMDKANTLEARLQPA